MAHRTALAAGRSAGQNGVFGGNREMKRLSTILGFALAAFPSAGWAALAPNYQRLAELQAVLAHSAVIGAFPVGQPIDKVEYKGPDLYRVTAGSCHLDVRIVSRPNVSGMVGPRQFTVEPGKPSCPQSGD
jgi:hypothetical protein